MNTNIPKGGAPNNAQKGGKGFKGGWGKGGGKKGSGKEGGGWKGCGKCFPGKGLAYGVENGEADVWYYDQNFGGAAQSEQWPGQWGSEPPWSVVPGYMGRPSMLKAARESSFAQSFVTVSPFPP